MLNYTADRGDECKSFYLSEKNVLVEQQRVKTEEQDEIIRKLMEDNQRLMDDNQKLQSQLDAIVDVEKSNEEEICSFCRENLQSQQTLVLPRCGHSFHRSCFAKYKDARCPLCRTPTEEEFPPLPSSLALL